MAKNDQDIDSHPIRTIELQDITTLFDWEDVDAAQVRVSYLLLQYI